MGSLITGRHSDETFTIKLGQQYATILYSEVSLNSGPVESRAAVPLPLPDRVVHPSARECGGVLSRTSAL